MRLFSVGDSFVKRRRIKAALRIPDIRFGSKADISTAELLGIAGANDLANRIHCVNRPECDSYDVRLGSKADISIDVRSTRTSALAAGWARS